MDQSVQQNAANANELSSTARSLEAQARQIQDLVLRFQLEGDLPSPAAAVAEAAGSPPIPARRELVRAHRDRTNGFDGA